ncbi:transposase, partial [Sphaerotilus natans]|uniref:transposase n=2 Tax=Sphaerotilus natans TaxID=34103 RepID=UPI0035C0BB27
MTRKPYPSDVSEEEWHFVAPYLTLMDVNAPQRRHDLGACQGSCRVSHAATALISVAAATHSRSGLSVTAPMGDQSR